METLRIIISTACFAVAHSAALAQDSQPAAPIEIPAFTAYAEPGSEGLRIGGERPVSGWRTADDHLVWYGELKGTGRLIAAVDLRLPAGEKATLRLRVGEQSRDLRVEGAASPITADFGEFAVSRADYCRFELSGVERSGDTFGEIHGLRLSGPAAVGAHFNLKPRRNAASVHLGYPTDAERVEWFYNEVTVREDPLHSFYMACGFRRGYFGIQVNSPTERRIIFSVWDAGGEPKDRAKVQEADRVALLAKGDGVIANDFGGEGTGGHSHLVYDWKTGHTYRFLLTAQPDGDTTVYTAYFHFPEKPAWGLIAQFRAPKDGGYLRGLHSFNENFWGNNGQRQRLAEFGPPWIRTADGEWHELTRAKFTHDPTGREHRFDYGAGVVEGRFYLSNGGFTKRPIRDGGPGTEPTATKFGDLVECPVRGKPPEDIHLP